MFLILIACDGAPGVPAAEVAYHWRDERDDMIFPTPDVYAFGASGSLWTYRPYGEGSFSAGPAQRVWLTDDCSGSTFVRAASVAPLQPVEVDGEFRMLPAAPGPADVETLGSTMAGNQCVPVSGNEPVFQLNRFISAGNPPAIWWLGQLHPVEGPPF